MNRVPAFAGMTSVSCGCAPLLIEPPQTITHKKRALRGPFLYLLMQPKLGAG